MQLTLSFLGSFQAKIDGNPIPESRSKKIEALLIYLAMESKVAHRRETLVGLLFPDLPDETARTNLRQTLTRLRRAIKDSEADPPFLLTNRETTQFNQGSRTTFDIRQFDARLQGCERHLRQPATRCADCIARLESAVALYRGPFLDGFFLEDSIDFDDWVIVYRERYQQLAISAFQTISAYYENRGEYATAQKHVERLLEVEPWDESTQRQYLRLLAYQGKRNIALKKYEQFSNRLYTELGVEPTFETVQLRQQIISMAEERPCNLQQRAQPLIGREEDQALIFEQLINPETRLITLVGHGGIGKTRLATEVGWHTVERRFGQFMHGTFFVSLAGINGKNSNTAVSSAILTTIAESVGYAFDNRTPQENQLLTYLKEQSLLLIIDNLEHVIESGRHIVNQILQKTTHIKIIITSRERLNLMVEWVHQIEGLPYPSPTEAPDQIEKYGAVQLFVQRAQQSQAAFKLSDDATDPNGCSRKVVAQICHHLFGMPLAIELATPLLRLMSCNEVLQEIKNSYETLSSKMHNIPIRHQSIQAVFESSWQLLNESEKKIVVNLSIFQGGFERKAAQQIVGADMQDLSSLHDKSLLMRMMTDSQQGRYQMQEMLQQFSNLKRRNLDESNRNTVLLQNASPIDEIAQAHSQYYLDLVGNLYNDLIGHKQIDALTQIGLEIKNIKLAWQVGIREGHASLMKGMETLTLFFYMRSRLIEGAELFKSAIESLKLSTRNGMETAVLIAALQARQGWFEFLQGNQNKGIKLLESSLDGLNNHNHEGEDVYPTSYLAAAFQITGNLEKGYELATQGLGLSKTYNNLYYEAINNNILSQNAYAQGNFDLAREHGQTSLKIERELGNQWSMGFSLTNLGRASYATGDFEQARNQYQESLAIRESLNDIRGQAMCLNYLGDALQAENKLAAANNQYEAAINLFQKINSQTGIASSAIRLGHNALSQKELTSAQHHFQAALRYAKAVGSKPQLLGAIIGLAHATSEGKPAEAYRLAEMVYTHSATSPANKLHAESLRSKLTEAGTTSDQYITLDDAISIFI